SPPPRGLSIEVPDSSVKWATAKSNLGFPAGKGKTLVLDLAGIFRPDARRRTNMEIYWDKLAWAAGLPATELKTQRLNASEAELRYRGFSVMKQDPGS